jgi:23S rRNA (cytidine1920-2'-O)/16S rRNA (cytidine1409-2'-O)-methyltransferase
MTRRRLDAELVRRGLAASPAEALEAVDAGRVRVGGVTARKVATMVADDAPVALAEPGAEYASRGGRKLAAALDRFGVDPRGRDCLDVGASTGGFTDCLLQRGAAHVVAVDVGYGQLAWRLRSDPRVVVRERTNVRDLTRETMSSVPDLVVADVSFVSLRGLLGSLARLSAVSADQIMLVKPQFEAARGQVGAGGVVRDPEVWRRVVRDVADAARSAGLEPQAIMASPFPGPAGNVEFPMHLTRRLGEGFLDVEAAIHEGQALLR